MSPTLHFIVVRSRNGWAVHLESDRLCEHASVEKARACAACQAALARQVGERASLVDLSRAARP